MFQLRPAPVQATWLGYPGTTGSTAIDWRITDAVCDPPEEDGTGSERLVRMPGFHCYAPDPDAPPPSPLPARTGGGVTFGSCNMLAKLSPAALALWAEILRAVPNARLMIKAPIAFTPGMQQDYVQALAAHGIEPARLVFRGPRPSHRDYLAVYDEIDIALDTFPYNGTTTTCDALWMGVPVITLRGDRPAARTSESLLRQLGLAELVAADRAAAVALASGWAGRLDALAALRASLRARMAASPLCDGAGFARRLERACRAMWHDWLARTSS
jgi:predicted O-linked N-acetylglucosamine transferase (SPINDLY family)